MARRCFYSFEFKPDCTRAAQVRNIKAIEGDQPATDNQWETIVGGGDRSIERWINAQLEGRSCAIVLVGATTANRRWINYEIVQAWNRGMGVVGIRIHGLKNLSGETASRGANPFDYQNRPPTKLSSIVKCYDPAGADSREKYAWISTNIANAVEEAIAIRKQY